MAEAKEIIDLLKAINDALKSTDTTSKIVKDTQKQVAKAFTDHAEAAKKLTEALKKSGSGLDAAKKKERDLREEVKKSIGTYKEALVVDKKYRDSIKKTKEEVEKSSNAFVAVKNACLNANASFVKISSSLGIATLSFSSIVKTGLDYKKSLFEVMQTQIATGRTSEGMSAALRYIKENTSLARVEFIELVKVIQKGFLGTKPTFVEMAKLVKMVGIQFGPSIAAQTEGMGALMSVQNQFPSLYTEVVKGMELVKNVSEGGVLSEGNEKDLALLKSQIARYAELKVISQDQAVSLLRATTPLTAEMKKLNDMLQTQQNAHKGVKDAAIELWASMEPMVMAALKAIKMVYDLLIPFKEVILGVGVGLLTWNKGIAIFKESKTVITACKTAMLALNVAVKANPWVALASVAVGAGVAIWGWINKSREAQIKLNKEVEESVLIQKQLAGLSPEEKKSYDEKWKLLKKEEQSGEGRLASHADILKTVQQEAMTAAEIAMDGSRITQDMNTRLDIQKRITGSLDTQLAAIQKFGGTSKSIMDMLVERTKTMSQETDEALKQALKSLQNTFKEEKLPELKIDFKGDLLVEAVYAMERLNSLDKTKIEDDKKLEQIKKTQANVQEIINKKVQFESDTVEKSYNVALRYAKQLEDKTTLYEQKLNTERQLIELSGFGLGASVDMMQKQVDLAYDMMQTYEDTNAAISETAKNLGKVGEAELANIRAAKTQKEAEKYITETLGKRGKQALALNEYASEYQEISNKSMQQQLKIYEITKEVREGYLSAINEMAIGAGHFSKIIGTQKKGTTQLMGLVKGVTGQNRMNTFAVGGMQTQDITRRGVGTAPAYQYTQGGLQRNVTAEQETQRNAARIFNMNKTSMRSVGQPKAGTGVGQSANQAAAMGEIPQGMGGKVVTRSNLPTNAGPTSPTFGSPRNLPVENVIPSMNAMNLTAANKELAAASQGVRATQPIQPMPSTAAKAENKVETILENINQKLELLLSNGLNVKAK